MSTQGSQTRICVFTPGVVHSLSRTRAIAPYFDELHYIDTAGKHENAFADLPNVYLHAPFSGGQSRRGGLHLQKLLREINPDGIVCHYAAGINLFNSILYNKCPVAAVAMGHDVLYDKGDVYAPFLFRLLVRMALRRVDFISAKSGFLKNRIRSYGYNGPLDVNYWGTDLTLFVKKDKGESRRNLGLPERRPMILSPRAVEPRLNIDLIVKSLLQIRERFPDVLLVVVGRTAPDYQEQIECFIEENSLGDNVRLVCEVEQEQLPLYYSASDVVVSMASSEGFPNTLLEVMACEVPVVAGRIPQIDELLEDGVNASLCKINADDIALASMNVLSDPAGFLAIVAQAKKTVQEYGDIHKNGRHFSEKFIEVIESRGRQKRSFFSMILFLTVYFGYLLYNKLT